MRALGCAVGFASEDNEAPCCSSTTHAHTLAQSLAQHNEAGQAHLVAQWQAPGAPNLKYLPPNFDSQHQTL